MKFQVHNLFYDTINQKKREVEHGRMNWLFAWLVVVVCRFVVVASRDKITSCVCIFFLHTWCVCLYSRKCDSDWSGDGLDGTHSTTICRIYHSLNFRPEPVYFSSTLLRCCCSWWWQHQCNVVSCFLDIPATLNGKRPPPSPHINISYSNYLYFCL